MGFFYSIPCKSENVFGTLKCSLPLEETACSPGKKRGVQKLTQPFLGPVLILPGSAGHGQKLAKCAGCDRAGETKAGQVRLCETAEREIRLVQEGSRSLPLPARKCCWWRVSFLLILKYLLQWVKCSCGSWAVLSAPGHCLSSAGKFPQQPTEQSHG